ncbi:hypothetical protein GCM10009674_22030 [Nesterenkonia xinjiangensis]
MTQLPLHIKPTGLRLPPDMSRWFLEDPSGDSWILHLPGYWGVDGMLEELHRAGPVAVIDGIGGTVPAPPEVGPSGLSGEAANGLVVLLWPGLLADDVLDDVLALFLKGRRRLLVMVRSSHDLPVRLADLEAAGRLRSVIPGSLSVRDLGAQARRRLGGPMSLMVLRRLQRLSAGRPVLADRLLELAQDVGVIREFSGYWEWDGDEEALHGALAEVADGVLTGLDQEEMELLTLVAVTGRLPERHAVTASGDRAFRSLMAQGILAYEDQAARGFADIRISAEAVRSMIVTRMRWTDHLRWWYERGRHIPADSGGIASWTALTWWRVRATGPIDDATAEKLARQSLAGSWYRTVRELVDLTEVPSATLLVLAARADHALGDVDSALRRLARLPSAADSAEIRQAILVAERIRIFHPERAGAVAAELRRRAGDESPTPVLDRIRALAHDAGATDELLGELRDLRAVVNCEESLVSLLWAGVLLGFRHQPDIGREVLSTLIDALRREGGYPDLEECAVAVLLLISATSGWRIDMLRVETDVSNERRLRSPGLAGVADQLAAVAALQDDRLHLAHRHASSAARIHARGDSFGQHWFSQALAVGAAGCMPGRSPAREESPVGALGPAEGFPWLRLVGEGLRDLAAGHSPEELRTRLEGLAAEAEEAGETVQAQVLLLLALLRGSPAAAQRVMASPWKDDPGRARLTALLAEAQNTDAVARTLDVAEHLLVTHSRLFGLSVLARLWDRRAQLERPLRIRLINLVLDTQRREGEDPSVLSRTFDLELDARERAVLEGLRAGHPISRIARGLSLSPRTVEAAISALLHRFGCDNRMELLSLRLGAKD